MSEAQFLKISVTFTPRARETVDALAKAHDRTISWIVSQLLEWTADNPEEAKKILTR